MSGRTSPEQPRSASVAAAPGRRASHRAASLAVPAAQLPGAPASPTVPLSALMARAGFHPVLLAGSRDPNAKLTIILIDAFGPALAVKVATTAAAAQAVLAEGTCLAAMHTAGLGALAASVPRPVGYVSADGLPAMVTVALDGHPMAVDYHAWRHTARPRTVRADFAAAGAWLAELHRRTAGPPGTVTLLSDSLDRIEDRFGPQPAVRAQLSPFVDQLARQVTPRTVVHGDYWFGNLLTRKGAVVGVVDWEAGCLLGEPLSDVARFAVSYALYLDRHVAAGQPIPGHGGVRADRWGAGLIHAVTGPGWFHDTVLDFCAASLSRLGADPSCAQSLLIAGIAAVAATSDHPGFARAHLDLLAGLGVDGTTR